MIVRICPRHCIIMMWYGQRSWSALWGNERYYLCNRMVSIRCQKVIRRQVKYFLSWSGRLHTLLARQARFLTPLLSLWRVLNFNSEFHEFFSQQVRFWPIFRCAGIFSFLEHLNNYRWEFLLPENTLDHCKNSVKIVLHEMEHFSQTVRACLVLVQNSVSFGNEVKHDRQSCWGV